MISLIASFVLLCLSSGAIGGIHSHLNLGLPYLSYPEKSYDRFSSHNADLTDLLNGYNGYYKAPLSYPNYGSPLYNTYHSDLHTQSQGGIRVIPAPHRLELLKDLPAFSKARVVNHLPYIHKSPVRYHDELLNNRHIEVLPVLKNIPVVQNLPILHNLPVTRKYRVRLVRPVHYDNTHSVKSHLTDNIRPLKNVAIENNDGTIIENHGRIHLKNVPRVYATKVVDDHDGHGQIDAHHDRVHVKQIPRVYTTKVLDDHDSHLDTLHGRVHLNHAPRVYATKVLDDHDGHVISGHNLHNGHVGHTLPLVTSLHGLRGHLPLRIIGGGISGLTYNSILHGKPLYANTVVLDDIHDSGIHSKGIEYIGGSHLPQILDDHLDHDIDDEIDHVDDIVAVKPQIVEEVEGKEEKPEIVDYDKKVDDDKQDKYDDESAGKDKDVSYQKEDKQYDNKDQYEKPVEKYPVKAADDYSSKKTQYDAPKYEEKKVGYGQEDESGGKYGQKSYGNEGLSKISTKTYQAPQKVSSNTYQQPKTYDIKTSTDYGHQNSQAGSYPKQRVQQQGAYGSYANPRGRSKQYRKSGGDVSSYEYEILHSKADGLASLNINSGSSSRGNDYPQSPVQKYTERPRTYSQDNDYKSVPTARPYEPKNAYPSVGSQSSAYRSSGGNYGQQDNRDYGSLRSNRNSKLSQVRITQESDNQNYDKIEQRNEEYDAGSSRSYSSSIGQSS